MTGWGRATARGPGPGRRHCGLPQAGAVLLLAVVLGVSGCSSARGGPAPPPLPAPNVAASSVAPAAPGAPGSGLEKSVPARVQIPSIGVDSTLMGLGLQADRSLQVPPTGFPAGWYTGAPTPGELGPAILAGHVDWAGHPGVFYELRNLEAGAEVTVSRLDGIAAVFRVRQVEQYPKDAFPTEAVYGNLDRAGLRLITCGGSFDRRARSYNDNIVAFADLVGVHPV